MAWIRLHIVGRLLLRDNRLSPTAMRSATSAHFASLA
jgi:hypothetical protein